MRLPAAGRLGGVCAGIAIFLDTDVTIVRILWIVLSIVPGALVGGAMAYIVACLIMPVSDAPIVEPLTRLTRSQSDRRIAGVCGGIAAFLHIDATVVRLVWAVLAIVPGAIVFGIVAYLIAWFIMPEPSASSMTPVASTV
jgi:phage shock protein PspC (stress-responsive transcriptional regulator)